MTYENKNKSENERMKKDGNKIKQNTKLDGPIRERSV